MANLVRKRIQVEAFVYVPADTSQAILETQIPELFELCLSEVGFRPSIEMIAIVDAPERGY